MEITQVNINNYKKILPVIELYAEFKVEEYHTLSEYVKISSTYNDNEDFLKKTLKIFLLCKEEFRNSYRNFLKISEMKVENYKELLPIIELYPEFKKS